MQPLTPGRKAFTLVKSTSTIFIAQVLLPGVSFPRLLPTPSFHSKISQGNIENRLIKNKNKNQSLKSPPFPLEAPASGWFSYISCSWSEVVAEVGVLSSLVLS